MTMNEQQPKLSIITAVYNQLPMNRIYWENMVKHTKHSFQLIVITSCGIKRIECKVASKKLRRLWNRISGLLGLFGTGRNSLMLMYKWM
jgi:hypothetical protein